jgi:restriction system protein
LRKPEEFLEAQSRHEARIDLWVTVVVVAYIVLVVVGCVMWPYFPAIAVLILFGGLACAVWWSSRRERARDRQRRKEDAIDGPRSLTEVDAMSRQEFRRYLADLCRRDGCTDVEVVGSAGGLGADAVATLPDGRRLVLRCKQCRPHGCVSSGDMEEFVCATELDHEADVAVFVSTRLFGKPSLALAAQHGVRALDRDLLGRWNSGTPLLALVPGDDAGRGDGFHVERWKDA